MKGCQRKLCTFSFIFTVKASVVQTLESAIHWINPHYSVDMSWENQLCYALDRDLCGWVCYPPPGWSEGMFSVNKLSFDRNRIFNTIHSYRQFGSISFLLFGKTKQTKWSIKQWITKAKAKKTCVRVFCVCVGRLYLSCTVCGWLRYPPFEEMKLCSHGSGWTLNQLKIRGYRCCVHTEQPQRYKNLDP